MTCETCGKEVKECLVCGGYNCSANCPDRDEDSCTCDVEDLLDDTDEF